MATLLRIGIALTIVLALLNLVGVIEIPWLLVPIPLLLPIVALIVGWSFVIIVFLIIVLLGFFSSDFVPEAWKTQIRGHIEAVRRKLPRH